MNIELNQIPKRIKELREILEIPVEDISRLINLSSDEYREYEDGKKDIPISLLYEIANILNVDMTVILTGEEPHMNSYTIMRKGKGVPVERFSGYTYSALANNFANKSMEPLLVTLEPSNEEPKLVSHTGQEFNLVLKGKVRVIIGKHDFVLAEGDSIYFDPKIPHGQFAVNETAQFLTVIDE